MVLNSEPEQGWGWWKGRGQRVLEDWGGRYSEFSDRDVPEFFWGKKILTSILSVGWLV